jgi:hypothetical protein
VSAEISLYQETMAMARGGSGKRRDKRKERGKEDDRL